MAFQSGQKLTAADLNKMSRDIENKTLNSGNNYVFGQNIESPGTSLNIKNETAPAMWETMVAQKCCQFEGEDELNDNHVYVALPANIELLLPIRYEGGRYLRSVGTYKDNNTFPNVAGWLTKNKSNGQFYGRVFTRQDVASNDPLNERYAEKYISAYPMYNTPNGWTETGLYGSDLQMYGFGLYDNDDNLCSRIYLMFDGTFQLSAPYQEVVDLAKEYGTAMNIPEYSQPTKTEPIGPRDAWLMSYTVELSSSSLQIVPQPLQYNVGEKIRFRDTMLRPWDYQETTNKFFNPMVLVGNYQLPIGFAMGYGDNNDELSDVGPTNIYRKPGYNCVAVDLYNLSGFYFNLSPEKLSAAGTLDGKVSAYLGSYFNKGMMDYQVVCSYLSGQMIYWTYMPSFYGWMRYV